MVTDYHNTSHLIIKILFTNYCSTTSVCIPQLARLPWPPHGSPTLLISYNQFFPEMGGTKETLLTPRKAVSRRQCSAARTLQVEAAAAASHL